MNPTSSIPCSVSARRTLASRAEAIGEKSRRGTPRTDRLGTLGGWFGPAGVGGGAEGGAGVADGWRDEKRAAAHWSARRSAWRHGLVNEHHPKAR